MWALLVALPLIPIPQADSTQKWIQQREENLREQIKRMRTLNRGRLFSDQEWEAIVESGKRIAAVELGALSALKLSQPGDLKTLLDPKNSKARQTALVWLNRVRESRMKPKLSLLHAMIVSTEGDAEKARDILLEGIDRDPDVRAYCGFLTKHVLSKLCWSNRLNGRPAFDDELLASLINAKPESLTLKTYAGIAPKLLGCIVDLQDPKVRDFPRGRKRPASPKDALTEKALDGRLTPESDRGAFSHPEVAYAYPVGRIKNTPTSRKDQRILIERISQFDSDNAAYDFLLACFEVEGSDKETPDADRCKNAVKRLTSAIKKPGYETYIPLRIQGALTRYEKPFRYLHASNEQLLPEVSGLLKLFKVLGRRSLVLSEAGEHQRASNILRLMEQGRLRLLGKGYTRIDFLIDARLSTIVTATATDIGLHRRDPLYFYQLTNQCYQVRRQLEIVHKFQGQSSTLELALIEPFLSEDEMDRRWEVMKRRGLDRVVLRPVEIKEFEERLADPKTFDPNVLADCWTRFQGHTFIDFLVHRSEVGKGHEEPREEQCRLLGFKAVRALRNELIGFLNAFEIPVQAVQKAAKEAVADLASEDVKRRDRGQQTLKRLGFRGVRYVESLDPQDREVQARLKLLSAGFEDQALLFETGAHMNVESLISLLAADSPDLQKAVQRHLARITGRPNDSSDWSTWWQSNEAKLHWDRKRERFVPKK